MGPIATRQAPNAEDRALLEIIKDAIGLQCKWSAVAGFERYDTGAPWNPLTDDGDALRLAVKLGLGVHQVPVPSTGSPGYVSVYTGRGEEKMEEAYFHSDPYAATRRAIVRAAAEVARAKR